MSHGAQSTGKTAAEMNAEYAAWADNQPTVTRCAHCEWHYDGTAYEGRKLAEGHRRANHPELRATRRRRGNLQRWVNRDDGWQQEGLANAAEVAAMLKRRENEAA